MARPTPTDAFKRSAAEGAVSHIAPGMVVGLGTGSTVRFALEKIARDLRDGRLSGITGIPSSVQTERAASALGIPLSTLERFPEIDLAIDGADEIDPELDLIKGGGGALLREKVIAQASRRFIVIADEGKLSPRLGTRSVLPVEVIPFAARAEERFLSRLGASVALRVRPSGRPFRTDQGNWILDADFGPIEDPEALARRLEGRAGVAGHGLFLAMADLAVVAGESGLREWVRPQD